MNKINIIFLFGIIIAVALLSLDLVSCTKTTPTTITSSGPSKGTLVQSDSVITGEIKAIKSMATGYPWEIDVLVTISENVGALRNPTIDKVGQVVQFRTDESTVGLKVGQIIIAHAKLTGDVEVGTTLYIYNIK
jgi:hypothetical protein